MKQAKKVVLYTCLRNPERPGPPTFLEVDAGASSEKVAHRYALECCSYARLPWESARPCAHSFQVLDAGDLPGAFKEYGKRLK